MENKQQVMDLFNKTRSEFLSSCRWVAIRIAQKNGGFVNIDEVREQVITPDGVNPKVYGAVFADGQFEKSGYVITTRKSSHGRPISSWFWKPYTAWKASKREVNPFQGVLI